MGVSVRESIKGKLNRYYGESDVVSTGEGTAPNKSYAEAKQAGDVKGMIGAKMFDYRNKNVSTRALSAEYAKTLGILDIQKRLPDAKQRMEEAEELVEGIYNRRVEKLTKEYQRTIGGLQDYGLARGKAMETVDSQLATDEKYQKYREEYLEAKKEYTALSNAKEVYKQDHLDLIEEEKRNRAREELLASGILDEE